MRFKSFKELCAKAENGVDVDKESLRRYVLLLPKLYEKADQTYSTSSKRGTFDALHAEDAAFLLWRAAFIGLSLTKIPAATSVSLTFEAI